MAFDTLRRGTTTPTTGQGDGDIVQRERRFHSAPNVGVTALVIFPVAAVGLISSVAANRIAFLAWTAVALFVVAYFLRRAGRHAAGVFSPQGLFTLSLVTLLWHLCVQRHQVALQTGASALDLPLRLVAVLAGPLPLIATALLSLTAAWRWWAQRNQRSQEGG